MTPNQIGELSVLWRSNAWKSLVSLTEELIADWHRQQGVGTSEFEYLKSCLIRDGKIEGVRAMMNEIERLANQSIKQK
ncbi:hypothetical protein A2635_04015 [Candidatus Peribacteria bacterium RIFCSPHIGHO2_01_FULL_51_9]|nr:MAG: hypothetical protein A2635_04015 [Candidatus Peribacteria bacterium RIFCSPHIGHO2_01_FULL_51_9]